MPNVFLLYGIGVGVGSPREWREIDNYYCQQWKGNFLYRLQIWRKFWVGITGATNDNIAQNHLNITLLNVF